MQWTSLVPLALIVPGVLSNTLLRFSCSQLNVQRLDPLVFPGQNPSPHLHQIIGGNGFNTTIPVTDLSTRSTCTTCTFTQDLSNYWTATLFFKAQNGSFHRVAQKGNVGFEAANGGMTVYYIQPYDNSAVTAFKPGFRMIVGNPLYRNQAQKLASPGQGRQLTFTCLQDASTRTGETYNMPEQPCAAGIMSNVRFPTCWDGVNLDTPNHQDHVAYPTSGTFESNGPCPSTHPVKIPQLFYEVIWDTTPFNDKSLWPTDGSQPFVWSYGDPSGFGTHGDYMFGWQGTSLQDAMKANCYVNCPTLQSQSIQQANQCTKPVVVQENIDGWLPALPGNNPVSGTNPSTSIAASIAGPAATVGAGV